MPCVIIMTGRHLRAARALLGWTQQELSQKARVAQGTVKRMEKANGTVPARLDTLQRIVAALERAGVIFLDAEEPGVKLRAKKRSL